MAAPSAHWAIHGLFLVVLAWLLLHGVRNQEFLDSSRVIYVSSHSTRNHSYSAAETEPLLKGRNNRVLITGITGMIGSYVAKVLKEHHPELELHGLVRWRSSLHNLRGVLPSVTLHNGDIQDAFFMRRLLVSLRPRYIYHFAAQAYNGVSWDSPEYTLSANILGTLNLLEPLRQMNATWARVLVAGSSTEYGDATRLVNGPLPETAPLIPVTPYGVSKAATEMLARQYFINYKIPVVIARLFVHVGTGHTENQAIQDFCMQVAEIEAGLRPPVVRVGNLDTKRDITDIRDAAPVIVKLAALGVAGEAYNVASSKAVGMRDLLEIILRHSRYRGTITVQQESTRLRAYDEKILLGDNHKLRNLTGWVPRPDYDRTIEDILAYWRREVAMRHGLDSASADRN